MLILGIVIIVIGFIIIEKHPLLALLLLLAGIIVDVVGLIKRAKKKKATKAQAPKMPNSPTLYSIPGANTPVAAARPAPAKQKDKDSVSVPDKIGTAAEDTIQKPQPQYITRHSTPGVSSPPVGRNEISAPRSYRRIDPKDDKTINKLTDYCVVDCETTGLSRTNDRIIEIAIIRYVNGIETETFSTLVNPEMHIPASASNVNHIFDQDVADAPTYREVAPVVAEKIAGQVIIGHNVTFDLSFIKNMIGDFADRGGISYLDTMLYSKRVIAGLENYKLQTLLAYLNIEPGDAHRATDDTRATALLFETLRELRNEHIAEEKAAKKRQRDAERQQYESTYSGSPLFNQIFVFTGDFTRTREEMILLAKSAGALTRSSVSGRTDYLVVGDVTNYQQSALDNKLNKAQAMAAEGGKIRLISEKEFLEIINQTSALIHL